MKCFFQYVSPVLAGVNNVKKLICACFLLVVLFAGLTDVGNAHSADNLVNEDTAAADMVIQYVNRERAMQGLPPVQANRKLHAAAMCRALELRRRFAHTRPDGRNYFTVLKDFGIRDCHFLSENLALGQTSAEEVVKSWMSTPGHRVLILDRRVRRTGVGYDSKQHGWVLLFTD